MAAKRLTRKEIVQQDSIRKTLTETSHWAVRHQKLLAIGIGVVIVGTLTSYIWQNYRAGVEEELQAAFGDALAIYHAPIEEPEEEPVVEEGEEASQETPVPPADPFARYKFTTDQERLEKAVEAFREVSEDYAGYRMGDLSQYYLGISLQETGRTEEAKEALDSLIIRSDFVDIRNFARNARAQMAAADGESLQVIELMNAVLEEPATNFPKQLVLLRLAETYEESGQIEQAIESYKKLVSEYAGSQAATVAQAKLDELEKVEPEAATEAEPPEADTATEEPSD